MTEKQMNLIDKLLKQKAYDPTEELVRAYKNGFNLSVKQASTLIGLLLSEENVKYDDLSSVRNKVHYTIRKRKGAKKHQADFEKICEIIGSRNINNLTTFGDEEYRKLAVIYQ